MNTFRLSLAIARTNFKLRNEGSYLGLIWYLLNPLALFLIILFIKNEAFRHADIQAYPVYLLIGILIFNFFTHTLSASITLISSYGNLLKSIRFDAKSLVIARVIQSIFSHSFELILLSFVMLSQGIPLDGLILYIIGLCFFVIFILGIAFVFAVVGVYVSDFVNVWTAISQALFFLTPIFFVPGALSSIYIFNTYNPLYYFLIFFRSVMINGVMPEPYISFVICSVSIATFGFGYFVFNKQKNKFAELV